LPGPALVMKNVMLFCCAGTLPLIASDITATDANTDKRIAEVISVLPWRSFLAVWISPGEKYSGFSGASAR
jgi:hypothetical protein